MTPGSLCVYIVDDDASVRDSLTVLLELKGYRTQAYASADEFLKSYQPANAGCLLLDVRMPGMSGLELQAALGEPELKLPIIVITAHGDVPTARAALIAGAADFLEKPVDPELLLAAVGSALEGDAARRIAVRKMQEEKRKLEILTARERQVLQLLAEGKSNKQVASALEISVKTAESHRANLMKKLRVQSLSDLVRYAIRNQMIEA